jgi:hypothetical protein
MLEQWDLWFPAVGATGLSFARSEVDAEAAGDRVLVHAAPPKLEVTVRDETGRVIAEGRGLERGQPGPMSFLVREGDGIRLEDGWPSQEDVGRLVILPGGEAGILMAWWHAEDQSEWRWQVEFYNHS